MKTKKLLFVSLIVVLLLVALSVGLAAAQGGQPERGTPGSEAAEAPDARSNYIPVQGRLTDSSGNPLNGSYNMTFNLYDVVSGGSVLCTDTRTATVTDGLFTSYMNMSGCDAIDGRQLYLGIAVAGDAEMTPRQYIDNVPYAWSLRPGAEVEYTLDGEPLLYLFNSGSGEGLWASSGSGEGVHGASLTGTGVAGYGIIGPGIYGTSLSGAAVFAEGKIASSEPTYLWISGSDLRPYYATDSTVINMDSIGGAFIERGATAGTKNVVLPITLAGTLYGQNVKLTGMDIYYLGETEFDGISAVLLRRQTGVCATASCYLNILYSTTDTTCDQNVYPTGCTLHYDLTSNNVLSSSSGVLYLTIEMFFSGSSTFVEIGGVRLTLEYDD